MNNKKNIVIISLIVLAIIIIIMSVLFLIKNNIPSDDEKPNNTNTEKLDVNNSEVKKMLRKIDVLNLFVSISEEHDSFSEAIRDFYGVNKKTSKDLNENTIFIIGLLNRYRFDDMFGTGDRELVDNPYFKYNKNGYLINYSIPSFEIKNGVYSVFGDVKYKNKSVDFGCNIYGKFKYNIENDIYDVDISALSNNKCEHVRVTEFIFISLPYDAIRVGNQIIINLVTAYGELDWEKYIPNSAIYYYKIYKSVERKTFVDLVQNVNGYGTIDGDYLVDNKEAFNKFKVIFTKSNDGEYYFSSIEPIS